MRSTLMLVAVLAVAGCGSSASKHVAAPAGSVARVGDTTIATHDLTSLLASAKVYYAARKRAFPTRGTKAYARLRDDAIRRLVQGAVFVEEAKKLGAEVTDKQLDTAIAVFKEQNFDGSDAKLRDALMGEGLSYATFREQERVQLAEEAVRAQVAARTTVSGAVMKAYYAEHKASYRTPPSRLVRHLLVKDKALADSLYEQLKRGASFAQLVRRYSTDAASKRTGGKLTDTKGTFVAPFENVAFSLKTGEVSHPVRSQFGWHIIQALGAVAPPGIEPYASVSDSIRTILLQGRQEKALTAYTKATYRAWCHGRIAYAHGYTSSFCAAYR